MCEGEEKPLLNLENMIGFKGSVIGGLLIHPDGEHLVYPVGCTVIIESLKSGKQEFFKGGSQNVLCVSVSKSGKYVAGGQAAYVGFNAESIIWNFEDKNIHSRMSLHKNAIQALAFSPNDKFLVSLGGPDDGSIVVWSIERKEAICGASAQSLSAGFSCVLAYSNLNDNIFITAGNDALRTWTLDDKSFKLIPTKVSVGQNRRFIKCIQVSNDDKYFLCGTTSGDVMVINMTNHNFQMLSPEKERFQKGITALSLLDSGEVIVGSGDGVVALIKGVNGKLKRTGISREIGNAVTSIATFGNQFYVGTNNSEIHKFEVSSLKSVLLKTCHSSGINNLCFPNACSELLVTCSMCEIKLWSTKNGQELLRICVANKTCNAVDVTKDGRTLLSGWDDGCIRAYYPESGNLMYTMDNTYGGSVSALASFSTGSHIISGSNFGHVVIWDVPIIRTKSRKPVHVYKHFLLKEHKAEVTCIKIKANDSECITSSMDGSCIFWDLNLMCRRQMIRLNTLFKHVAYHPLEHQVLTTGTDRKIGYWEIYDASTIRFVEGSLSGSVNSLDVSENGKYFVSGGDDKLLKIWLYEDGEVTHIGIGHSAPITAVKISPNQKHIFSTSVDGAILKWTFPFQ